DYPELLTPTRPSGPGAFRSRLHLAWLNRWRRLRRFSSRRTDPDFNRVGIAIASVNNYDSLRIDSTLVDQVIQRAPAQFVCLASAAGASRVDDDVGRRVRRVL